MIDMLMLLVALLTTLLCFLSATACLRFIVSRQGWFWVLPLVISLMFLYISIAPLKEVASGMASGSYQVEISPDRSVREIVPLIIVLLWYAMIITFRYALKSVVPDNRHIHDTEKNLNEARYMQQVELRRTRRAERKRMAAELRLARKHSGTRYPPEWIALFDDPN